MVLSDARKWGCQDVLRKFGNISVFHENHFRCLIKSEFLSVYNWMWTHYKYKYKYKYKAALKSLKNKPKYFITYMI